MKTQSLIQTAQALLASNKGILAMDESTNTCNQRFAALNIPQTEEARRAYREMLITTPRLGDCISGVILYDETIRQQTRERVPFVKVITRAGIIPGIKVDTGVKDLAGCPGEKITEGLDGLRERLLDYHQLGARFAKWRTVFTIDKDRPSRACMESNANDLARYAALCQEANLVPIVEPEVLMEGDHSLEQCSAVTEDVLHCVFDELYAQDVLLEGMILKPNMVLPGLDCPTKSGINEVADATIICLLQIVPAAVSGIAFLSGGQSPEHATAHLNAMNTRFMERLPWPVTFSFARAIQQPALQRWAGLETHAASILITPTSAYADAMEVYSLEANAAAAQQVLYHRASCNQAARRGEHHPSNESA